jgi:hypothetical protein
VKYSRYCRYSFRGQEAKEGGTAADPHPSREGSEPGGGMGGSAGVQCPRHSLSISLGGGVTTTPPPVLLLAAQRIPDHSHFLDSRTDATRLDVAQAPGRDARLRRQPSKGYLSDGHPGPHRDGEVEVNRLRRGAVFRAHVTFHGRKAKLHTNRFSCGKIFFSRRRLGRGARDDGGDGGDR